MNISPQMYSLVFELVFVFLVFYFSGVLLKKLFSRPRGFGPHLSMALLAPLRAMLAILFLSFGIELVRCKFSLEGIFYPTASLRNTGIILCCVWLFTRWKKAFYPSLVARLNKKKFSSDPVSLDVLGNLVTIFVFVIASFIILQLLGVDIVPLITFGGIGAAVLGFASRDVLANAFAGIMLYTTRPFGEGDEIELPEKNISGHIEKIGWYVTVVRDLQKRPIYIPNTFFSSGYVMNISRMTHRCIQETLRISFSHGDKVSEIVEKISGSLKRNGDIDQSQPIYVCFQTFGTYSLDLEVRAYAFATRYEDFMQVKQKVLLEAVEIISQSGAEIPHPLFHL